MGMSGLIFNSTTIAAALTGNHDAMDSRDDAVKKITPAIRDSPPVRYGEIRYGENDQHIGRRLIWRR
jgi:hypothetical protein